MAALPKKNDQYNAHLNDTARRGFRHLLAGISALAATDAPTPAALEIARMLQADLAVTIALLQMRAERQEVQHDA